MKIIRREWHRIILLMIVGNFMGEVLSRASSLWNYFTPPGFFFTFLFYGLHLAIIEDLDIRYKLNYPGIFLTGMIYGVLEEAFFAKTFFYPSLPDFGTYGRAMGINTIWALFGTFFHGLITVTLTFVIVDILMPRQNDKPVLSKWHYIGFISYLLVVCYIPFFFFLAVTPKYVGYRPSVISASIVLLILIGLILKLISRIRFGMKKPSVYDAKHLSKHSSWRYGFTAAAFVLIFFYPPFILREMKAPWLVALMVIAIVVYMFINSLHKLIRTDLEFNDKKKAAICTGAIVVYLLIGFPDATLTTNPPGVLGALILIILINVLARKNRVITT